MRKPRMTAEQAFKKRFVERRLAPMLADATDGYVASCTYDANRDDEMVTLGLDPGACGPLASGRQLLAGRELKVNVSCDSKWAIAHDVLRELAKVYG